MLAVFAEEWPLLLFTLFAQLAIGAYLFIVIIRSFNSKIDRKMTINITKKGMFAIGPVMLVALILSVLHLGVPLKAYLSIGNLSTSWLSREILFAGLFFGMWIISYILDRTNKWSQMFGWLTSAVGLLAVYSMASIYTKTIIPAWTDVNTYLAFFGTTILFGVFSSMIMLRLSKQAQGNEYTTMMKRIGLIGLGAVVVQIVYLPVYMAGIDFAAIMAGAYIVPTIIRWILPIVALLFVGYSLLKKTTVQTQYSLYVTALTLVLAGEFLGRLIFYATGLQVN